MTLDERIEAGAKAIAVAADMQEWDEMNEARRKDYRIMARAALGAGAAELFTDPPHWLAPHEATDAMLAEVELVECGGVNETRVAYGVLRDAYLGRGQPPSDEYRAYVAYLAEKP